MGTYNLSCQCVKSILLACLAISTINAQGLNAKVSAGPSGVAESGVASQADPETADKAKTTVSKPKVSDDYIIGPSDILSVSVWKDTELSKTVTVRPDGKISLPLAGELRVSGMTPPAVTRLIAQRLAEYISAPQVTVIVQEVKSQSYILVGKVTKPGAYELGKPTTVLEAIAIAGGFLDFAKTTKIYIMRRQPGSPSVRLRFNYKKVIKGKNTEQNVELRNGDTIVVP